MPNDAKTQPVPMSRIGAQLKEAREKKSVTIEQVQKQTRIHATVLKALEDGRCDDILTPTYVKSFLKKYAEYLSIDARQILAEYAKARPAPASIQIAIPTKSEPVRTFGMSGLFRILRPAIIVAVAAAVFIFAAGLITPALKHWAASRTARAAKLQPAVVRPAAAQAQKKKPQAKTTAQEKDAPVKSAVAQKETTAKEKPAAKTASATPVTIPKSAPLKLVMKVSQQTMVKVRTDGSLIFERVLSRGTVESFTANDRINIYVAKGEAIELFLNGRSLGSPGKGIFKNLEITRTGLKIK